MVMVLSSKVKR